VVQSLAGILIIGGMIVAFLWKAAFYINLILCLIITFALTYLTYNFSGNAVATIVVFFMGLFASWAIAAIGGLLTILEGFTISTLGFWGFFVGSSPSSIFSFGTVIQSIIASIVSTVIAVFVGGRLLSTKAFSTKPSRNKSQSRRSQNNAKKTESLVEQQSLQVETLPEKPRGSAKLELAKPVRITDEQEILETKNKIKKQLVTLEKNLASGKISEATGNKLRDELMKDFEEVDKNYAQDLKEEIKELQVESNVIENQITELDRTMDLLESQHELKIKEEEEVKARWRIRRIDKKEFKAKEKLLLNEMERIERTFDENSKRKQQLEKQRLSVNQSLQNRQEALKNLSKNES
jgi:hypothetical protein